jgi:hypothetical protein
MKGGRNKTIMEEEEFEEFEEDFEDDDTGVEVEPEPLPQIQSIKKPIPQPIRAEQKPIAKKYVAPTAPVAPIPEEKVKEERKVEPQAREAQITAEDLIAAIQNHEQRLTAIESALFRLRGAI